MEYILNSQFLCIKQKKNNTVYILLEKISKILSYEVDYANDFS